ncbi:MAG TPA: hypothetical protein VFD59_19530, partial [Nocardioidaceae bacterium]|nr:hypothetical protein [Nocardioidaceae bacterium]
WEACLRRAEKRLGGRVRLVTAGKSEACGNAQAAVFTQPVTGNPELELLPFLREQAVSVTTHRFGTPFDVAREVVAAL